MKQKNIFSLLPLLMVVVIIAAIFFSSCKKDPVPVSPTVDTENPAISLLDTVNNSQNSITLKFSFTDNKGVANADLYVDNHHYDVLNKTSQNVMGLTASTVYAAVLTVKDAAGNSSSKSITFTTLAAVPVYTAVANTATSYEASAAAEYKNLPGNAATKGIVVDVTTVGTARVEITGSLIGGGLPIDHYWINSVDNSKVEIVTSTFLNNRVPETAITTSSFVINLPAGINVINFKTSSFVGNIVAGTQIGIKITLANGVTYTNSSYTADPTLDLAEYVDVKPAPLSGFSINSHQEQINRPFGGYTITPLNSVESYDGLHYPKLCGMSLSTVAYPQLDFTDASGSGQNFHIDYLLSGDVFSNLNATYNKPILTFVGNPYQTVRSNGGNYAYIGFYTNLYNSSTTDFSGTVWLKPVSFKFYGNPETRVYDYNSSNVLVRIL